MYILNLYRIRIKFMLNMHPRHFLETSIKWVSFDHDTLLRVVHLGTSSGGVGEAV